MRIARGSGDLGGVRPDRVEGIPVRSLELTRRPRLAATPAIVLVVWLKRPCRSRSRDAGGPSGDPGAASVQSARLAHACSPDCRREARAFRRRGRVRRLGVPECPCHGRHRASSTNREAGWGPQPHVLRRGGARSSRREMGRRPEMAWPQGEGSTTGQMMRHQLAWRGTPTRVRIGTGQSLRNSGHKASTMTPAWRREDGRAPGHRGEAIVAPAMKEGELTDMRPIGPVASGLGSGRAMESRPAQASRWPTLCRRWRCAPRQPGFPCRLREADPRVHDQEIAPRLASLRYPKDGGNWPCNPRVRQPERLEKCWRWPPGPELRLALTRVAA